MRTRPSRPLQSCSGMLQKRQTQTKIQVTIVSRAIGQPPGRAPRRFYSDTHTLVRPRSLTIASSRPAQFFFCAEQSTPKLTPFLGSGAALEHAPKTQAPRGAVIGPMAALTLSQSAHIRGAGFRFVGGFCQFARRCTFRMGLSIFAQTTRPVDSSRQASLIAMYR